MQTKQRNIQGAQGDYRSSSMNITIQHAFHEVADLLSARDKFAEQEAIQVRRAWLSAATQLYKALGVESNDTANNTTREIARK